MNDRNRLVLLVGGPDRCAKTTILKELSNRLKVPYFKASNQHSNFISSPENFLQEVRYADPRLADFLRQTGHSALIDRFYACQYAYDKFFSRPTDVGLLKAVDKLYASIGARVLICTRMSFAGISDDLNPKLDSEALARISGYYTEFLTWTECDSFLLYVDDHDLERQVSDVVRWIERVELSKHSGNINV